MPVTELSTWRGATTWIAGSGALAAPRLREQAGPRPAIAIDEGLLRTETGARALETLSRRLGRRQAPEFVVGASPTAEEVTACHERLCQEEPTSIIALGGGSVLDLAVLAAVEDIPKMLAVIGKSRSGLYVLPGGTRAVLPRIAVPTTLGTGAEVSAAACCDTARGKHLLLGHALRPEYACVDPVLTRSLPGRLVAEAIVEILARVLVPLAQTTQETGVTLVSDSVARASLAALSRLAWDCAAAAASVASDQARLTLATISSHTHSGWGQVGRHPFASPVWFAATEVSYVFGWTKAFATARLLPVWAQLVLAGDTRWGDTERLETSWRVFDTAPETGDISAGVSVRLTALCRRLCPGQGVTDVEAKSSAAVERLLHRWGGDLPMLSRFTEADLYELVYRAVAAPGVPDGS
jgi:alcohol dehydrogenase YqhD (iron-dependent ADH family)